MKNVKKLVTLLLSIFLISSADADINECEKAFDNKDYNLAYEKCSDPRLYANNKARYIIALIYENGYGNTDQNQVLACMEFLELGEKDYCDAFTNISSCYRKGLIDSKPNLTRALEWDTSCKILSLEPTPTPTPDTRSIVLGINAFFNGEYETAIDYLIIDAEKDNSKAQFYLGYSYYELDKQDLAIDWLNKSAVNGYEIAIDLLNLGYSYYELDTIINPSSEPSDTGTSVILISEEVQRDFNTKCLFSFNRSDYVAAFKECGLVAEQGHKEAQYYLGLMYEEGDGITKDYKEAAKWYRMAANQKFAEAQFRLGKLYFFGQGVPQNYQLAASWSLEAADQGNADAKYRLGVIYYYGHGFPEDKNKGIDWLTQSANQGNADAIKLLRSINSTISEPEPPKPEPPKTEASNPIKGKSLAFVVVLLLVIFRLIFSLIKSIKEKSRLRIERADEALALKIKQKKDDEEKVKKYRLKIEVQERREAEAKAKREAEAKAKREAEAKAKREAEAKAKREAEAKAKREAEAKAKREAEAKAEAKAKKEAEDKKKAEIKRKKQLEEYKKAALEKEKQAIKIKEAEAEAKAKREAEAKAKREAEAKAKREAEAKAKREALATAKKVVEAKAKREAEAKAKEKAKEKKEKLQTQKIKPKFIEPNNKRFEIIKLEHGSKEWTEWRNNGINSNDAEKIYDNENDRLIQIKNNKDNIKYSKEVDFSSDLMQEARDHYEIEKSIKIFPVYIQDKRFPWLQASIDGFSKDFSKLVKISCSNAAYKDAKNNIFPKLQLQHLLMITGLEKIDYWCYSKNKESILIPVRRDQKMINQLYHRYINSNVFKNEL